MTWFGQWLVGVLLYSAASWALLLGAVGGHWLVARLLGLRGILPTRGRSGAEVTRVKRSAIWLGGILVAYGLCATCSLVGLLAAGKVEPTRFVQVMHARAAERGGMRDGDEVISIEGEPVRSFEHLRELVSRHRNQLIRVEVLRRGGRRVLEVTPDSSGLIGVTSIERRAAWRSTEVLGLSLTYPARVWTWLLRSFTSMMTGREAPRLSGPAGVARYVLEQAASDRPVVLALYTSAFAAYLLPAELLLLAAYLCRKD
jgi:regulator of sigma E protease